MMDCFSILTEEEQEVEVLVESLYKPCTSYQIEISAVGAKLMTNSANGIQRVKGQKLGTITNFKYLRAVLLMMAQTSDSLKDCTSHCHSYKAKANLER